MCYIDYMMILFERERGREITHRSDRITAHIHIHSDKRARTHANLSFSLSALVLFLLLKKANNNNKKKDEEKNGKKTLETKKTKILYRR